MKKAKCTERETIFSSNRSFKGDDPLSINPTLKKLILAERLKNKTILDVGCGRGRVAIDLAPYAKKVIGIDLSKKDVDAAKKYAASNNIDNAEFICTDAEKTDYLSLTDEINMVVSNLCMSDIIIKNSYNVLQKGQCLVSAMFHVDHWIETKKVSPFSYTEERINKVLSDIGFNITHLLIEKDIVNFKTLKDALDFFQRNKKLMEKFKTDERWQNIMDYLQEGGRSFTYKSHFILKAKK
jgi:SAM-dependent methyltransferase